MRLWLCSLGIVLALCLSLGEGFASAQDQPAATPTPAEAPAEKPATAPSLYDEIRETILRADSSPEVRRSSSMILLRSESPEAGQLLVALLKKSDRPEVQLAVSAELAEHLGRTNSALNSIFVEPLIDLLASSDVKIRESAVRSLSAGAATDVVSRLGLLARNAEAPEHARHAALDVLAYRIDNPLAMGELVSLLSGEPNDFARHAIKIIEGATEARFGDDMGGWQAWWKENAPVWVDSRLDYYRQRAGRSEAELQSLSAQSLRRSSELATRLGAFQREYFRSLSPEQREEKLASWLRDPVAEVRETALAIIVGRVGDEGYRPANDVLDALIATVSQEGQTELRRRALHIIENLNNPAVVSAILNAIKNGKASGLRCEMLRSLGRLGSQEAVPTLVQEVESADSRPACVQAAAVALGQIAARLSDRKPVEPAVGPLKTRYAGIPADQVDYRAAVLEGMAGVAHPSFEKELLDALESDHAKWLVPAMRGLVAINNSSRLPRFRTLTGHADPAVRLHAVEAVGQFGKDDADAECVLGRMNPKVEANAATREEAWSAFRTVLRRRPVPRQLEWVPRLNDLPGLKLGFLEDLERSLASQNGSAADGLEIVRDRLASVLLEEGKHAEAAVYLRNLYSLLVGKKSDKAPACGIRLLVAVLRSGTHQNIKELVTLLATNAPDDAAKAAIVAAVTEYINSDENLKNTDRAKALLAQLKTVSPDSLGDAWVQAITGYDQKLNPPPPAPASEPTPTPTPGT